MKTGTTLVNNTILNQQHRIKAIGKEKPAGRTVFLAVALLVMVTAFLPRQASGQTGAITGEVSDAETGESLSGALVIILGSNIKTSTDADGRYILRRIDAGDHILEIRYMGYTPRQVPVTVSVNEPVVQHVDLVGNFTQGEVLNIATHHREQSWAMNRNRESTTIQSVITSDQMELFGDYTVEDALVRVAGVQVGSLGEINLRGVGYNRYNLTIDGQQIGTTGMGDRSYDLGSISTDIIQDVEVIKVLTPDMDADALAGRINIVTHRPARGQRVLQALVGGAADTRYFSQMGPGSRASLKYVESPRDDFSFALNLNHQLDNRAWESLGIGYDMADFGDGPVDVIEHVSPGLQTHNQNRFGGNLRLTYQPSNRTTFHALSSMYTNNRVMVRHSNSWAAGGDWISPTETGLEGEMGSYSYDARRKEMQIRQNAVQAGGRHLTELFDVEYHVGWAWSRSDQRDFQFPFLIDGLDMAIDMEDRSRPEMQVSNMRLMTDGTIDRRLINLQDIVRKLEDIEVNKISSKIDLTLPFSMGEFKVGSSAKLTTKNGIYRESDFNIRRMTLFRFMIKDNYDFDIFDNYHIPWMINTHDARLFFDRNRLEMSRNLSDELLKSDIWNYTADEHIYAGYGMVTLDFGPLTLSGGVRSEYTDARYDGRQVVFNFSGDHESTVVNRQSTDYMHLFPNARVQLAVGARTDVRLAWSRSMARPDFNQLAPFELVNAQDTTLFRGNPELAPMTSDNLDLFFDRYFANGGVFSFGLFHKQLSGFPHERRRTIAVEEGEFPAFDEHFNDEPTIDVEERMFHNSDETATIYGVELAWQQSLSFLPGFLSNFGTYANYTWTHSILEVDYRDDEVALPYQSPHVVNAALDYSQGRFTSRLSYHWTAAALTGLQQNPRMAPSINPSQEVYMDYYQDGWTNMSLSLRYLISSSFQVWTDISNLLNMERIEYTHTRDLYPVGTDIWGGRMINMGVRYNL